MLFKSTRNEANQVAPSKAILEGLAPDGGLYVPVEFPTLHNDWSNLQKYSYQEMAYYILSAFLDDFSEADLKSCINNAYDDKFDTPTIAPLVKKDNHYYLELFHGSTLAFKDMALSILPYLMKKSADINDNTNEIVILTATSGDTGKAAMAGFADVPGTQIIVFYPKGGVSSIQERQMLTQEGDNTHVVGVNGNFDDAQTQVKALFNDIELREQLFLQNKQFSSANSMNIGRLLPQIVYYYYAYATLVKQKEIKPGDSIDFSVPTGNFGNILAGYYAKRIGLPIGKLICASNDNTVLYDFFETGVYDRNRDFKITISPSMDILISSNFERLLYHALEENTAELIELMNQLATEGKYEVDERYKKNFADFIAEYANEAETREEIAEVYDATDYIIDPHSAVASKSGRKAQNGNKSRHPLVNVSTASPFKFPQAVLEALDVDVNNKEDNYLLNQLKGLMKAEAFPPAIVELKEAPIRHDTVIDVEHMKETVQSIILN